MDDYEDGGDIVKMIHESRAAKRGLTWNEDRYRYETQDGQPILFNLDKTWRVVTEEEWYLATADHDSHA